MLARDPDGIHIAPPGGCDIVAVAAIRRSRGPGTSISGPKRVLLGFPLGRCLHPPVSRFLGSREPGKSSRARDQQDITKCSRGTCETGDEPRQLGRPGLGRALRLRRGRVERGEGQAVWLSPAVPVLPTEAPVASRRKTGIPPRAWIISTVSPSSRRQVAASVTRVPIATGRAATLVQQDHAARIEAPVEMTSSTSPTLLAFHDVDSGGVEQQALLGSGRDGLYGLGDGIATGAASASFAGSGSRRGRAPASPRWRAGSPSSPPNDEVELVGGELLGELGGRPVDETNAVVHRDKKAMASSSVIGMSGRSISWDPTVARYVPAAMTMVAMLARLEARAQLELQERRVRKGRAEQRPQTNG